MDTKELLIESLVWGYFNRVLNTCCLIKIQLTCNKNIAVKNMLKLARKPQEVNRSQQRSKTTTL